MLSRIKEIRCMLRMIKTRKMTWFGHYICPWRDCLITSIVGKEKYIEGDERKENSS